MRAPVGNHQVAADHAAQVAAALGLLLIEDLVDVLGGTLAVLESQPDRLHVEALVPVTSAHGPHSG